MEKTLLPPDRVQELLGELCVKLGFCLKSAANTRIINSPPRTIDRFAQVVFSEEGMDWRYHQERHGLYNQVREVVARYFDPESSSNT